MYVCVIEQAAALANAGALRNMAGKGPAKVSKKRPRVELELETTDDEADDESILGSRKGKKKKLAKEAKEEGNIQNI